MSRLPLLLALGFVLATVSMTQAQTLELAPEATKIVLVKGSPLPVEQAAGLLQYWLRKATASKTGFAIVNTAPAAGDAESVAIVLNDPAVVAIEAVRALPEDGFQLSRNGRQLSIAGSTPQGAYYGAIEFLSRVAGVRFYMPTELFTSLPENPRITVDQLNVVSKPWATSVFFSGINRDEAPAAAWAQINGAWRRKGGTHQHNMFEIFPPAKFAERYPEIYPTINGKRYIPATAGDQGWQPNLLEPRAVDAAVETITEFFQKTPNARYVAVSIQDGHRFDDGEQMSAVVERFRATGVKDHKDRAFSSVYWAFVSRLAERIKQVAPGKLLCCLAYGPTRFPPDSPLPDNVLVFTNFHIGQLPTDGYMDEASASGEPGINRWLEVAKNYGNHDWYQGSGYYVPRSYSGYWSRFVSRLRERGVQPFIHVECYPNWGLDGPKYWVLTRLLWDPSSDPEKLMSQLCADLFGPAAGPMNRYFSIQEKLWHQINTVDGPERKLSSWGTQFRSTPASQDLLRQAREALKEAQGLLVTEPQKQRYQLFADCFRVSDSLFEFASSKTIDPVRREEALTFATDLTKRQRLAAHHEHTVPLAIKTVTWDVMRAARVNLKLPTGPSIDVSRGSDDPAWSQAVKGERFVLEGGDVDRQQTQLWIARDTENFYVHVICPRVDQRVPVEVADTSWRSDNIEFLFDTDNNWDTREQQFWIKPSGLLVDWCNRDSKEPTILRSSVAKTDTNWQATIKIPLAYFGGGTNGKSEFSLQVIRNEFTPVKGFNNLSYKASWTRSMQVDAK